MERIQIYLTPEQKEALKTLGGKRAIPMAELIRQAIDDYLSQHKRDDRKWAIQETFGAVPEWMESGKLYTRRLRSNWRNRPQVAEEGEPYCHT